jgi:hypothetical protein
MIEMLKPKGSQKFISIHGSSNVAKNIEGCFKIFVSYLACSQIWLNLPVDHCHFGYSTKLPTKKKNTTTTACDVHCKLASSHPTACR